MAIAAGMWITCPWFLLQMHMNSRRLQRRVWDEWNRTHWSRGFSRMCKYIVVGVGIFEICWFGWSQWMFREKWMSIGFLRSLPEAFSCWLTACLAYCNVWLLVGFTNLENFKKTMRKLHLVIHDWVRCSWDKRKKMENIRKQKNPRNHFKPLALLTKVSPPGVPDWS